MPQLRRAVLIRRLALSAGLSAGMVLPAAVSPGYGAATERVSVSSAGVQGNGNSGVGRPAASADGRFVAFVSRASNLVPGDTNARQDVFVRDRRTDQTERVSVDSAGRQASDARWDSEDVGISADGRFVAFTSSASNLVPVDANGQKDVFVRDRLTDRTERVSVAADDRENAFSSSDASISADGRFIAFRMGVADPRGLPYLVRWDVFVRDRARGTTERVTSAGQPGAESAEAPAISPDGGFIAFASSASEPVNGSVLFVHDRNAGITEKLPGTDSASGPLSISAGGRLVAFTSGAANLVAGDTNQDTDVFAADRSAGTVERVSVTSVESQANDDSAGAAISADGQYIAFYSSASNLSTVVARGQVFRRDRTLGRTEQLSVDSAGVRANGHSEYPGISADGRTVVFPSCASNLVAGDSTADCFGADGLDVFVSGPALPDPPPLTCAGLTPTLVGSGGSDVLSGTARGDVIVGLGGDDAITGAGGDDVICGDGGATDPARETADTLSGGTGADRLMGAGGADNLAGGGGTDTLEGGRDDDTVDGGGDADVMSGGDGRDLAEYRTRTAPVTVTLGSGANDGGVGEGDDVGSDVERVRGGYAGDRLVGNGATNWLYGGPGDDELVGGGGWDSLFGEAGGDVIDARDGEEDAVSCGTEVDGVDADALDTVAGSCEGVRIG